MKMVDNLIRTSMQEYEEYLRDESRLAGTAQSISFPKDENEILEILAALSQDKIPITVQGARTGIAGGAAPESGHILNLNKMDQILGLRYDENLKTFLLKVQTGVLLSEIREALLKKTFAVSNWSQKSLDALELLKNSRTYFFSPDPTETSASIGGMVACNASGARSFKYGSTRKHIEALRIILVDGDTIFVRRGEHKTQGRSFIVKTESGRTIEGNVPKYMMPNVKNASGYYVEDDMDLVDVFIGCEGTLGIITEIDLRLLPHPKYIYCLTTFFTSEDKALKYIRAVREKEEKPASIEYFNHKALNLLREQKKSKPAFSDILDMPDHFHTAVYVEYHGDLEEAVTNMILEASKAIVACGGREEDTWLALNTQTMQQLHAFRHAVPESVNLLIDERRKTEPNLTKLGTDMAVPDEQLEEIIDLYNTCLQKEGLDSVTFGHIGNNHVHVNILPRNQDDYAKGKSLYTKWASEVIKMGGTVSAEHGIGKMKKTLLKEMLGEEGINEMKALKALFDVDFRLNPGNLF